VLAMAPEFLMKSRRLSLLFDLCIGFLLDLGFGSTASHILTVIGTIGFQTNSDYLCDLRIAC
ncbi:MAG TPA: hypothetical protein QGF27_04310, partial [Arenicellales bacterium]|nr:hypothetical protein [Arenicellales bacterium]